MSTKQTSLERFLANGKTPSKVTEETLTLKKTDAFNKLYYESYLKYVFIATSDSYIPTPLCKECCYWLSHKAIKPSKLFCHLINKHPGLKNKPLEYFEKNEKMKNRKNF